MPFKRLSKAQVTESLRLCLSGAGRIILSKHFREELEKEQLDILDAYHILRTGQVFNEPELDARHGDWNYRMEGTEPEGRRLAIVFCFKEQDTGLLITIFSIRA
jgi:hypothetical protein